jgi:DNA-directed RNA polymerase subunit M/transcription elongation factor TFIIS
MKVTGLSSVGCKRCDKIMSIVEQQGREILVCGYCGHAQEIKKCEACEAQANNKVLNASQAQTPRYYCDIHSPQVGGW